MSQQPPYGLPSRGLWPVLICLLCLLAAFSVLLLNGRPLFYFDSVGYVNQGTSILRMVVPSDWLLPGPVVDAAALTGNAVAGSADTVAAAPVNTTVNGSRSAIFAVVMAALYHMHLLALLPVIGALTVLAALWLPLRVVRRQITGTPPLPWLIGLPLLMAAAGSLPFYIAYLMPDIFAPVLILICAGLVAFGPDMQKREILLAAALGLIAVLLHPSHLLIAAVMLPVVLACAAGRRGWWLAPLIVAGLVLGGAAERLLFRSAVKELTKSEVTYFPFITARMIADGPGLTYLETHCPDAAIPTCVLHAALSLSDDPMRLTASHIAFETSPELGSFRRMSQEDQRRVVDDQIGFLKAVVLDNPIGVVTGVLRNTLIQAYMNSVEMTIAANDSLALVSQSLPDSGLQRGRLVQDRNWLPPVETSHRILYGLSLAVIALVLALPGRVAWQIKLFAAVILLGILANAFVCGAVSQPANRYGARVIWLLPMLAGLLSLFAWPKRRAVMLAQMEDPA